MLKIHRKTLLALIAVNLSLPIVHAAENNSVTSFISHLKSSFVTSLSIGPSWDSAGQAQTLNLAPNITKTYTTNRSTSTLPTGEFFLGIKNSLPQQLEGQIGLAVVATGHARLTGDVWDDADPTFDNYTYKYKVSHTALNLKGKLLFTGRNLPVIPWISAALGVGFNRAYNFNNTPIISEAVSMPNFTSNTKTAFTYAVGIGIQRQLIPHLQIGVGYEFSDWGNSQLGAASGQSSNQGLSLSHLYTNSILLNVTYSA